MQCKAKGKGEKIHTEKAEHRALLRKFNFHMEIWSCIEGRASRQGASCCCCKEGRNRKGQLQSIVQRIHSSKLQFHKRVTTSIFVYTQMCRTFFFLATLNSLINEHAHLAFLGKKCTMVSSFYVTNEIIFHHTRNFSCMY